MLGLLIVIGIACLGWKARRVQWSVLAAIAAATAPLVLFQSILTNSALARMGEPATMLEPATLAISWATTALLYGGVYLLMVGAGWVWRRMRSQG